jgi:ribosomal protein L37E
VTRHGARLRRLEGARPRPEGCDRVCGLLIDNGDGVPRVGMHGLPFDPATSTSCRRCGGQHYVVVRVVVVPAGHEGSTG